MMSLRKSFLPCPIDRRVFLERLLAQAIAIAGSYPLAHRLLQTAADAAAPRFPADSENREVIALPMKYPGRGATLAGYLAKPMQNGLYPALIVIQSESGLNEHIRVAARRYAKQGFVALAVDPLSRRGGTTAFVSPAAARAAMASLPSNQLAADLDAAFHYLQSHRSVLKTRIGITDFSSPCGQHRARADIALGHR